MLKKAAMLTYALFAMLTYALLLVGCSDSPMAPEAPQDDHLDTAPAPSAVAPETSPDYDLATAPAQSWIATGSWMKLAQIQTGVGVWIHRSDPTKVVIGLGKYTAAQASYTGSGVLGVYDRLTLFRRIARYFGAPRYMGLEKNKKTFKRVRNGKDVGLWILVRMTPSRYSPTSFQVLGVAQRPTGTHNPPYWW